MSKRLIRIAHSPDSDDAFMFYALAKEKLDTGEYQFEHILSDIETLNQRAKEGVYEVSAISFHAFPLVSDKYALLSSGSSMGDGYGPMVIAREPLTLGSIRTKEIAVPGLLTTALLALKMFEPRVKYRVLPFEQILPAVKNGEVELGLIIHEGQLTYAEQGLHEILNLGVWWKQRTGGLPLPLGVNVIRKDLGEKTCREVSSLIKRGIQFSLEHRQDALQYALSFARGMDPKTADKFVGMYVNELTVDYGERGREALRRLFTEAFGQGLIGHQPDLEFVS